MVFEWLALEYGAFLQKFMQFIKRKNKTPVHKMAMS
jgi:hypothetical protein